MPDRSRGLSASLSRFTWVDLKRWEFEFRPVELIRDGRVDRVDLTGWFDVVEDVRLSARAYLFDDQRGDGTGGEVAATWQDALGLPASLRGSLFHTDGSFTDGNGLRLEMRTSPDGFHGSLGYELFRYENVGSAIGDETYLRHTIRGGAGWQVGSWYYNLFIDYAIGDVDQAASIGLFAEFRF